MPDDAAFCSKCGMPVSKSASQASNSEPQKTVIAPQGATSIKCPNCGAPISPKFGEMVITCEYCGSGITLGNQGWSSIQKQSMLPLKFASKDDIIVKAKLLMDQGFLHRHLQERLDTRRGEPHVHTILDRLCICEDFHCNDRPGCPGRAGRDNRSPVWNHSGRHGRWLWRRSGRRIRQTNC